MLKQLVNEASSLVEAEGGTLKIRGRDYTWEPTTDSKGGKAYILKGKKGADYTTMRNVPHPEQMFVISRKEFGTPEGMKGVWLTDKDGTLVVLKD